MSEAFAPHLLTQGHRRRSSDQRRGQQFLGDLTLAPGRVHEFCGTARRTLALTLGREMTGPVFWIRPAWTAEALNPVAVTRFLNPGRLTFMTPCRAEDLLWTMEEALRSGAVPLVVADLPGPPALTPVRRLHLAAETGAAEGDHAPIGLILTPGSGGAQGIESRWAFHPTHKADRSSSWRLSRLRARTQPESHWHVRPRAGGGLSLGARADLAEK